MEQSATDVLITPIKRISLPHGDVLRAIKTTDPTFYGFGEAYFSYINYQSIKAWKVHKQYTANFIVPLGKVAVMLYKELSNGVKAPDYPKTVILSEDPEQYHCLTIPPGIYYGFEGLANPTSLIFTVINGEHSPSEQQSFDMTTFPCPWKLDGD